MNKVNKPIKKVKNLWLQNMDLRAWISSLILISFLILMPLSIWVNFKNDKNLEERKNKVKALVEDVYGVSGLTVRYSYVVKGKKYLKVVDFPSEFIPVRKDFIFVYYDSLNPENSMPMVFED